MVPVKVPPGLEPGLEPGPELKIFNAGPEQFFMQYIFTFIPFSERKGYMAFNYAD